jgi:hypothetical protein
MTTKTPRLLLLRLRAYFLSTDRLPNTVALDAVQQLIDCGVAEKKIQAQYQLIGHRQNTASRTECPGDRLFEEIKSWPHWTADPQRFRGVSTTPSDQTPKVVPEDHKGLGPSPPSGRASMSSANLFVCYALAITVILKQCI